LNATPHASPSSPATSEPLSADAALVRHADRLRGELRLPGDKSISHRALMLAALAAGESRIEGAGDGADVRSTAGIVRALGATVERVTEDGRNVGYRVVSPGADGLIEPGGILDCGNSGTSLRLLAGVLAGLPMTCILDGDASLRGRPVARIIEPLRSMGAVLHARRNDSLPPLTVVGHTPLRSIDIATPVPSAQVKSAILLAGLRADGRTTVRESVATRDHTERMLEAAGARVTRRPTSVTVEGGASLRLPEVAVPGDISSAAPFLVGAAIVPGSAVTVHGVGLNPRRARLLDVLERMGVRIAIYNRRSIGGEPAGDVEVRASDLVGATITAEEVPSLIDELPILAVAACHARGETVVRGAEELRAKESNRIEAVVEELRRIGGHIRATRDGFRIKGVPARLRGGVVDSRGDHRLAMLGAIAGVASREGVELRGAEAAATSFPGFYEVLEQIAPGSVHMTEIR